MGFTSSMSQVLAKSRMSLMFSRFLSARPTSLVSSWQPAPPSFLASYRVFSSFWIRTMLVWYWAIRTREEWSPLWSLTMMSKIRPLSTASTWMGTFFRKSFISFFCSGVTSAMTSSCFSDLPPTIPAAAAAWMPFSPSVLGTTTLFTFLMMLPLTPISTLSGISPRISRALAAA